MSRTRTARSNSAGKLLRTASMMLAALFLLLSPVCDVAATPASSHAAAAAAGHGHSGEGNCCVSIDAQALAAPAAGPLPTAFPSYLFAPPRAAHFVVPAFAAPTRIVLRRAAAPPLSYHARSLRRLD
jgi:hypothetical protein